MRMPANFGVAHDFDGDHIAMMTIVNLQSTDLHLIRARRRHIHYPPATTEQKWALRGV